MTAPDLSTYRAIHLALRAGADLLADVATTIQPGHRPRVAAMRRYWDGYAAEVHTHHTVEDDLVFPALVARVPVAAELIRQTDDDHATLGEIVDRCHAAVGALERGRRSDDLAPAFAELAVLMRRHLDLEDDDVLPLIERHFTVEEYAELDAECQKRLRLSEALFTVPFVSFFMDDEQRTQVFAEAPLPLRVVHRLTRRRHARLVQALVGAPAARAAAVA